MKAAAIKTTTGVVAVLRPESVAVVREGKTEVVRHLAAVEISGGEPVPPDARFSIGFRDPVTLCLVQISGARQNIPGAQVVLVRGGHAPKAKGGGEVLGGMEDVNQILRRSEPVVVTRESQPQIENLREPHLFKDELEDYEDRYAVAQRGPNGEVLDEFHTLAMLRANEESKIRQDAIIVGNPPSAFTKKLGGNQLITLGVGSAGSLAAKVSQNVLYWQGKEVETGPVTVVLGQIDPIGVVTTSVPLRPYAIVLWGSFGQVFTAEIDIGMGIQFTVNCNTISVDVGLDGISYAALPASTSLVALQLAAFVSFKQAAGRKLTRTLYVDGTDYATGLAVSGTQTVVVPNFATDLSLVQMSDRLGSIQLDFIDTAGNIAYSLGPVTNGSLVMPVPLAPDIVKVKVTNTGTNAQRIRLPFGLGI